MSATKATKSPVLYAAPELALLGSVEKLTAGNQSKTLDGSATNPTYIYSDMDEEKDKPKK